MGIKLFEYLGLDLSIEYILNTQTQMLEFFEYTCLRSAHTKSKFLHKKYNDKIKKLGSAYKVVFFISRKSRVIISSQELS
jgi:hypothetical protein